MAQSEAGRTVTTISNHEEEEEFGPQLITKLEVCTNCVCSWNFTICHFRWIDCLFFGYLNHSFHQINGITAGDIKRLQAEGFHTVDSLMYVPKKALM